MTDYQGQYEEFDSDIFELFYGSFQIHMSMEHSPDSGNIFYNANKWAFIVVPQEVSPHSSPWHLAPVRQTER